MIWRRARKGERCGYCVNHIFNEGDPVLVIHPSNIWLRCAPIAKARYGQDVPDPFPEPVPVTFDFRMRMAALFGLIHQPDAKSKQAGDRE